jgi:hypothetical protein
MPVLFSNNASATLASSITSAATSVTLTTGQGTLFPTLSGSNFFYATLSNSSNQLEIVKVTARATDVLTVVRAQEGTTARAYAAADKLELRVTAAGLTNMAQLDAAQTFSGANTFSAAQTFNGTVALSGGGSMAGTFSGTPTFSGAITFSSTVALNGGGSMAGTITGTPTFSGAVTFSGSPVFSLPPVLNNNITLNTKDTGGTLRSLISLDNANYANIYNAGNVAVRILNQTGASSLVTLSDASGNFTASGNVTANSDERIKTNWRELSTDFLQALAAVKAGVYDRKDTGITQVGVSAQSLQTVLPQAIQEGTDGLLSVAYGNAALVAAVELAREVVSLRSEVNQLKGV